MEILPDPESASFEELFPPLPPPPPRQCRMRRVKVWYIGRVELRWRTADKCALDLGHDGPHLIGWRKTRPWP